MFTNRTVFVAATSFALVACGGGSSKPSTVQTVGSTGATLTAGAASLTIPAGALAQSTQVTLREAEPRHQGRSNRIEVEPHGLSLAQPARLSVNVDDSNARVKMHDGNDDLVNVEVEDQRGPSTTAIVAIMPLSSCSRMWQWKTKRPSFGPSNLIITKTRAPGGNG